MSLWQRKKIRNAWLNISSSKEVLYSLNLFLLCKIIFITSLSCYSNHRMLYALFRTLRISRTARLRIIIIITYKTKSLPGVCPYVCLDL
jgi:hypothetical protein